MMLYSFGHPMQLCCTLLYIFLKKCCVSCFMKCCFRLATLPLNTIKQHATMCNKCCMMFYEMLYSFGGGFKATSQLTIFMHGWDACKGQNSKK